MVKAEFFLQLLVRLLTDPARLDRGHECAQRGAGGEVGEIELPLAARASLADEPHLLARHVLVAQVADPLRRPVGDAHAHAQRREARGEPPLGASAPGDGSPGRAGEDCLGGLRHLVRDVTLARSAAAGAGTKPTSNTSSAAIRLVMAPEWLSSRQTTRRP